jgi:hypothetical protein
MLPTKGLFKNVVAAHSHLIKLFEAVHQRFDK